MTRTRIAFLDVDGTLIDHSQQLADSVVEAVRGARANGHLMYLCTGRSRVEIPAFITDIGFDGVVSAGGGFVEHGDDLVAANTMPRELLEEIVTFFESNGIEYTLQGFDGAYPSRGLLELIQPGFAAAGVRADDEKFVKAMSYRGAAPLEGIAKSTFFGSDPTTYATVRDGLGERFHVITGTMPYLGEAGGEVSLGGMHKGAAVVTLVEHLGLSIDDAIAIGDSSNDLEMLQMAGLGIAMGNADASVKAVADEVTTGVDDDGIFNAFKRHGLI